MESDKKRMSEEQKKGILDNASFFAKEVLFEKHYINTKKLKSLKNFDINPFTVFYLSKFLTGNTDSKSIAKALIYPRVLGTSIATSFGQNTQKFISKVLNAFASPTTGIDIEFHDYTDNRKKYCQLKAGPNTINKDDIDTIVGHFKTIKRKARADGLDLRHDDLIVGVLYGTNDSLSDHYKKINDSNPVYAGKDFWTRLTGDEKFYDNLIQVFTNITSGVNGTKLLEETIDLLAAEIEKNKSKII